MCVLPKTTEEHITLAANIGESRFSGMELLA